MHLWVFIGLADDVSERPPSNECGNPWSVCISTRAQPSGSGHGHGPRHAPAAHPDPTPRLHASALPNRNRNDHDPRSSGTATDKHKFHRQLPSCTGNGCNFSSLCIYLYCFVNFSNKRFNRQPKPKTMSSRTSRRLQRQEQEIPLSVISRGNREEISLKLQHFNTKTGMMHY